MDSSFNLSKSASSTDEKSDEESFSKKSTHRCLANYPGLKARTCSCTPSILMRSTHATLGIKSGFLGLTCLPVGRVDTSDQAAALARQLHCIRTAPGSFCDAVQLPGGAKHNARIFLHRPFTQWVPKCGHGRFLLP
jgi:hypothetical protein